MELPLIFYGVFAALGYVLLQSLFILGVRIAAMGATEKLPNGEDKDSEMILFPLFKYLSQVKKTRIYYTGEQWDQLLTRIRVLLPGMDIESAGDSIRLERNDPQRVPVLKELNNILPKIDGQIQVEVGENEVKFFKIDEVYRFNKYLRKPVIQCPICMASYWSTISYWIPVIYFFGFSFWVLYLGILNICAVACVNWIIFSSKK
jgi:hypothetical protein